MFEIITFKHSWKKSFKRYWAQVNLTKTLTLKEGPLHLGCVQINKRQATGITHFLGALQPLTTKQPLLLFILISLSFSFSLLLFFACLHVAFMQDITYQESRIKLAALTVLLTMYSCICTPQPVQLNAERAHQFKVHANSKAATDIMS